MPCLICRYFQPTEPQQHKQDREAGRCESRCGDKWTQGTAVEYVKNHGEIEGWCRLHPVPKRVVYNHVCGDVSVVRYFLSSGWGVNPFDSNDNIFEWAQTTLGTVIHGNYRSQRLAEQNTTLRRQLKHARKVSAARLERLKTIEAKPEPEPPAGEVYPRLVAAE
jgi:hypothetical protein